MNESLVKYLAGLLDADGSLSFAFKCDQNRPDRYFAGLKLHLASSDAVDKVGFVTSLPLLTGMGTVNRGGPRDQFIDWYVSRRADLEMLIPRLVKHMVIKAGHWEWLLNTWRNLRSDRGTISAEERAALTTQSKESRRSRVGPLKPKNHPTWAWLAGYLDGDGTYHYRHNLARTTGYWQWKMAVSAVAHVNDRCVLDFLHTHFGGGIGPQWQSPDVLVWTRSLGYQNRAFALRFLPRLAKHSRLKRPKIDAMIHHHRQRLSIPGTDKTFCAVEDCEREAHGNGMCSMHYQRERKSAQKAVQATV
jgi:hypothetical protein